MDLPKKQGLYKEREGYALHQYRMYEVKVTDKYIAESLTHF